MSNYDPNSTAHRKQLDEWLEDTEPVEGWPEEKETP